MSRDITEVENYFGPCIIYMCVCVCQRLCFVFVILRCCVGLFKSANECKLHPLSVDAYSKQRLSLTLWYDDVYDQ